MKVLTVSGNSPFPIDMLRVEQAWPANESDVMRIIHSALPGRVGSLRIVYLRSSRNAGNLYQFAEQWASAGWVLENVVIADEEEPDA